MKINKSKAYILPLLTHYVDLKYINKIENTYLFLENDLDNYIIVKYKQDTNNDFSNYLIELSTSDHCKNIIHQEDHAICIFEVDGSIRTDYERFILGQFSKISSKNKKKILSFSVSNYGNGSIKVIQKIKQILHKDKKLREELEEELDVTIPEDSELSSIPDINEETLKL